MLYVPENPEDVREHKEYHDKIINGLSVILSENNSVVWVQDDFQLIVIDGHAPKEQRQQAEEVARIARLDTPYGAEVLFGEDELETHVFLLQRQKRNIGLLTMEKRVRVWRYSWAKIDSGQEPKELPGLPFMWSICFIWILKSFRRSNLGKTMLGAALEHLRVSLKDIGWYIPFTDDGTAFVRNCCPDSFFIAK